MIDADTHVAAACTTEMPWTSAFTRCRPASIIPFRLCAHLASRRPNCLSLVACQVGAASCQMTLGLRLGPGQKSCILVTLPLRALLPVPGRREGRNSYLLLYQRSVSSTGDGATFERHRASCALLTLEVSTIAVMHRTENQAVAEGGFCKSRKTPASTDLRIVWLSSISDGLAPL